MIATLDGIVQEGTLVAEPLPGKDQALLVVWDVLEAILDLRCDVVDGVDGVIEL